MKAHPTLPNLLGPKILIVLYSSISLIPRFEAVDPIGSQWVYLAVVNLLGLIYLYSTRKHREVFKLNSSITVFFISYLVLILWSAVSLIQALSISEGIKDLSRMVITFLAIFNLFSCFILAPKALFKFQIKVIHIVIFFISVQVVFHFVENYDLRRTTSLLKETELLFGNRNVTAAALSMMIPFVLYGLYTHRNKWRWISIFVLFLGLSGILFIGARASFIALGIVLITFFGYAIIEGVKRDGLIKSLRLVVLPIGLLVASSLMFTLNINRIHKGEANSFNDLMYTSNYDEEQSVTFNSPAASRISQFRNGRLAYYQMAIHDFKEQPITGIGLGNWKLANKDFYFKNATLDQFLYPLRVHNDFLQVLSETGIVGFLAYLTLFVILFLLGVDLLRKASNSNLKWLFLSLICVFLAYGIDAAINFPMERTPTQGVFALLAAIILAFANAHLTEEKTSTKRIPVKPVLLAMAILGLAAGTIAFAKYQSYVHQNYILADISGKNLMKDPYTFSYQEAKQRLDGYFEIAGVGRPNQHVLGMYAMSEGKNDLALEHLSKSIALAPNHYESKMLKAIIFGQRINNPDSTIYYAKQGFEKYPAIKNNYVLLLNAYREKGDTVNYFKTFDARLERFPEDVSQWKAKATRIMEFYKDPERAAAVIDEAIKYNPQDTTLVTFKERFTGKQRATDIRAWYKNAFDYIAEKNYPEAKAEFLKILEVTPSNNPTLLNLGIIEIKMKQYEEAVTHLTKVIEAKAFKDGRPEYNRGLAYERLKMYEPMKRDYRASKNKGYALAQKLPESKLQ